MRHRIVFQPLVRLDDWSVFGFEALSRFDDHRSPVTHLGEASGAGNRVELELQLIEAALTAAADLPGGHLITVNASIETAHDERLVDIVRACRTHEVGLELDEASIVTDYESLAHIVRRLGVALLIDDAGSRNADLERVRNTSAVIVKLDRTLVQHCSVEGGDLGVLLSYIRAAHESGALALAEGVETVEQAKLLLDMGCDLAQGYLFGHPDTVEVWSANLGGQGGADAASVASATGAPASADAPVAGVAAGYSAGGSSAGGSSAADEDASRGEVEPVHDESRRDRKKWPWSRRLAGEPTDRTIEA